MTDNYNVNGAAISSIDSVACGLTFNNTFHIIGIAINSYEQCSCPFVLRTIPNGLIVQWEYDRLVFSVYANQTEINLDTADIEFIISDQDGELYSTKSTSDYSVITFGNTLVVHINARELLAESTMSYLATITTPESSEYLMSGQLFVGRVSNINYDRIDVTYPTNTVQLNSTFNPLIRLNATIDEDYD